MFQFTEVKIFILNIYFYADKNAHLQSCRHDSWQTQTNLQSYMLYEHFRCKIYRKLYPTLSIVLWNEIITLCGTKKSRAKQVFREYILFFFFFFLTRVVHYSKLWLFQIVFSVVIIVCSFYFFSFSFLD